jgi:hypothetical protein
MREEEKNQNCPNKAAEENSRLTFWLFTHGKIKPNICCKKSCLLLSSKGKMRPEKEEKKLIRERE